MNLDFETFKRNITWYIKESDNVNLLEEDYHLTSV
jgi:hypothetical protein